MKQKLKRFMAGFMAMLTLVGTLFTNGTTAFAASPQANIAFWNASVKNSGEVSELKPGYNHGKILYSILDGNSAYCMNFGLRADGGQLMNSYDDASTSMSAQQRKLLSYCLYYGFNSTQKAAPSNSQCDEYIATQAMVWVIVADIFGTGSGDSAARKLCNTAPSPDSSYSYYERLRDNISSSYNATLPSFASRRTSEAPTYELKWNEGSQRFETTLSDSNGVLSDFDFGISGYSVDKNGNSITISSMSVNTTATTGTFTSNAGKVETTSSCVFWLTGKSGYQEFISERPTADPIKAYDIMREMFARDGMPQEIADMMIAEIPPEQTMWVISNEKGINGAASMLYENELHELAESLESDLYILPSSVHEVIAVSSDMGSPEMLAQMVVEVNMQEVSLDERLSNQVYHYDKDLRKLTLATDTPNKRLDGIVAEPPLVYDAKEKSR